MTDQQFITDLRLETHRLEDGRFVEAATSPELIAHAGITWRQIDYWERTGRLHPYNPLSGSGCPRLWPASEVEIATTMARLIAGGFQLQAAHDTARRLVAGTVARVGDGLVLLVRPGER